MMDASKVEINIKRKNNYVLISINGNLDIYTSPDFKKRMEEEVLAPQLKIIIDLENVKYIDSSGIGTLIKILNSIKNLKGDLFITGLHSTINKVFKVAGLSSLFNIVTKEQIKNILEEIEESS